MFLVVTSTFWVWDIFKCFKRILPTLHHLQGTTVYPLLASVLCDESEWENPHSFYPAHFLDKDGKFVKRDAFMPFSAGLWAEASLPVSYKFTDWWPKLFFCSPLQVAELVLERVWPRWSSSSSSPHSCSTFVSLLLLEFQRMSWIWLHLWASPATLQLINCVLFPIIEEEGLKICLGLVPWI